MTNQNTISGHETMKYSQIFQDILKMTGGDSLTMTIVRDGGSLANISCHHGRMEPCKEVLPLDTIQGSDVLFGDKEFFLHVSYLYRDAYNYKISDSAVIGPFQGGKKGQSMAMVIISALVSEEGFIPSELGMNDLQEYMVDGFNPEVDDAYHEIVDICIKNEEPYGGATKDSAYAFEKTLEWIRRARMWDVDAALSDKM